MVYVKYVSESVESSCSVSMCVYVFAVFQCECVRPSLTGGCDVCTRTDVSACVMSELRTMFPCVLVLAIVQASLFID